MELMRVTSVDYIPKKDDGSDPTVRVCGRSRAGERMTRLVGGTRPHCYVPAGADLSGLSGDVDVIGVESGYETHDGDPVDKVTVRHPKQVNDVEDHVEWSAESDIPYYRRATWDYGLSGYIHVPEDVQRCHIREIETDVDPAEVDPIEPRVVIGDIEVYQEEAKTFDEMKDDAEDPIVAITLYDTRSQKYVLVVRDPEDSTVPSVVKEHVVKHWDGHDLATEYVDADIEFVACPTETDLLNTAIGRIQEWRPDLLAGWNWIDFDHPYLVARCQALDDVDEHKLSDIGTVGGHKDETLIDGLPGFDQMAAYDDKVTRSENRSNALEYVANEELGIGKMEAVDVGTAYETDRSRLAAYNLLDVQLCVALTDKHAIEEFYMDLADLTGIQVYDVFYEKRLVDGWIASRADDDQVLPNQADRDIPEPAGGLVLAPSQGVTEDVAVLDLKSLYPSSMITCNISPETMTEFEDARDVTIPGMPEQEADVDGTIDPSDINWERDLDLSWSQTAKWFSFHKQGILAEAAMGPFAVRDRYKVLRDDFGPDNEMYVVYDRKQGAVKVVHNSMFGVMNSSYYRLARPGIGDAITGVSRYVLWRAAEKCKEIGYDVIYGDTDSVLVKIEGDRPLQEKLLDAKGLCSQLNDFMGEVADDLGVPDPHPYLADAGLHGTDQHAWTFEFEKFYESFIQCGQKKRYAGILAWKEGKTIEHADPDVTGFESQRADVPKVTAEVQDDVIKRVLQGDGFADVSAYVREQVEEVRALGDLDEIGIPKSLSKPLDDYPNMPRVRAARHANEHLGKEFGPGDTMWMFYAARTPTGTGGTDVFGVDWNDAIPDGYEVDEERTIVKAFESALTPIVEEVGWSFEEIRSGKEALAAEADTGFDGDPFAEGTDDAEEVSDDGDDWTGAEAW